LDLLNCENEILYIEIIDSSNCILNL